MRKILFIFLTSLCMLLTGCNGNDRMPDSMDGYGSGEVTKPIPEEFVNPFKCIGVLHNEAMDSIQEQRIPIEKLGAFTDEFTDRHTDKVFGLRKQLQEYAVKDKGDIPHVSKRIIAAPSIPEQRNICDSVIQKATQEMRSHLNEIHSIIDGCTDKKDVPSMFKSIDQSIYRDNNLEMDSKSLLWAINAIAEASFEYNIKRFGLSDEQKKTIIIADFLGGVEGALEYDIWGVSLTGSVVGPDGVPLFGAIFVVKCAIVSSGVAVVWSHV